MGVKTQEMLVARYVMIRMIAFRTPFKVEIPSCKHWLSIWLVTLQCEGLVWYMDGSRLAGRSGAGEE
jgi:hypothetical protein